MERFIRKRDGSIVPYDRARIIRAVSNAMNAVGCKGEADEIAKYVEILLHRWFFRKGSIPHVEEIQDIVERTLMEKGYPEVAKAYILYRQKRKEARDIKSTVEEAENLIEQYIARSDWRVKENSNMNFSLQGMNFYISSSITARYWLNRIYTEDIKRAHDDGDFHIHDLGLLSVYTYYGKEVVIVKDSEGIKLISFEDLYNSCNTQEKLLNERDGAYAKYPVDIYVLDKDGWTKVKRIVKKKKDRYMRFLKNRGGRSVIVTDNHPIITRNGERMAKDVQIQKDETFTVDIPALLKDENLFEEKEIDLLQEIKKYNFEEEIREKIYFNGFHISEIENTSEDGYIHTLTQSFPGKIPLTEELGYLIGFILAEGYLSYDEKAPRTVTVSQKERDILAKINKTLVKLGIPGCINRREDHNVYELVVKNVFFRFLLEKVFGIRPGARHKTLPVRILHYDKEFIKGLIAGFIDGDGSISSSKTTIDVRISSRALLEQMAYLMTFLGITPRDRNLEGAGTIRFYKGREIHQNFPLYGLSFRKTDVELPSQIFQKAERSSKAWHDEDRNAWHIVLNNEKTEIPDDVIYDITTESTTLIVNGMWNHNCVGWDLEALLRRGFGGVAGKIESRPPKHLRTALGQMVNFFYTLQGEAAGAQAFSNFTTYLAPFIRYDGLDRRGVRQALQEFLFNVNVATRSGFQTPFTNITMDLEPPENLKNKNVIIGGKEKGETYGEFHEEMDLLNDVFAEVMMEGDAKQRIFTFPIPTYNITKDFDWKNEKLKSLWEMTAKFGIPYFANFVHSDMKPEDARSMCCRLRLDNRELRKRGGGLFGASPMTGSIGVVTINMPRIGYLSRSEDEFLSRLERLMILAKNSLEMKRKVLEDLTEKGLYPYSRVYLSEVKKATGSYWTNHFSTIGLVGMNEACMNFLGVPITTKEGKEWAIKILNFMREKLADFQEETGNLYNLEATPAEGTSYRLAKKDKERFASIFTQGDSDTPYYTNSVHPPVYEFDDIYSLLEHQDDLQVLFTGGTVVHLFLGEPVNDWRIVRELVRRIVERFRLPYFSITPTFSICPVHGYIPGEHHICPYPHTKEELERFGVITELTEEELSRLPENAYIKPEGTGGTSLFLDLGNKKQEDL